MHSSDCHLSIRTCGEKYWSKISQCPTTRAWMLPRYRSHGDTDNNFVSHGVHDKFYHSKHMFQKKIQRQFVTKQKMSHNYVKITDPTFLLVCFMELLPGPTSQQFPSCPGIKSGWLNNANHFGMDKPNAKDTQENVWTATKASCQLFIDKRFNVIRNNVICVRSKEASNI